QIDVVDTARTNAAAMIFLGDILQRRLFPGRRLVNPRVEIEFEDMAVRIAEPVGAAMAEIAVAPADAAAHRLYRLHAALKRLGRRRPVADMADAGRMVAGKLQRVKFVIVE